MSELADYVTAHAERGACQCGWCLDAPENPADRQPAGHTADLVFFKVKAVSDPSADRLRSLARAHKGEFAPVDVFDGAEHSYLEIGGWIGDQNTALVLMGLGKLLGLWDLLTPGSMFGDAISPEMQMQMAQAGCITIKAKGDRP